MKTRLALALALLFSGALPALEVLRLPWIFSDQPEIYADFNFSPGDKGKTRVELSLGGRFSRFGLPRGAARAPRLEIRCEFVSPGELISQVADLKTRVDLAEVLASYAAAFSSDAFSSSAPYVFKSELKTSLAPGDYNVIVSFKDVELSISSRRTLHVIVPEILPAQGVGDLKFCLGIGESLDAGGTRRRVIDPNPWRQLGGASGWGLTVIYDCLGPACGAGMQRRYSVWRLRGDIDQPLWSEEAALPSKTATQSYVAQLPAAALASLGRGTYVFKVEIWAKGSPKHIYIGSKTFEILP